jgi:hypothetical protein
LLDGALRRDDAGMRNPKLRIALLLAANDTVLMHAMLAWRSPAAEGAPRC